MKAIVLCADDGKIISINRAGGVADSGVGIPEEEHEKVFEFAYSGREGGYGLGLAMVQQIVEEEHGGQVSLDSRPGEGTRLKLMFPRDGAPKREKS